MITQVLTVVWYCHVCAEAQAQGQGAQAGARAGQPAATRHTHRGSRSARTSDDGGRTRVGVYGDIENHIDKIDPL